ncbi:MAG: proprotein convertase P-domain-containing protein [Planctomycetota bacterium]
MPSVPSSSVAELLATSPLLGQDYSLTLIRGELPPGAYTWSGWTTAGVSNGTLCSSIHHPAGSYKRISFAQKASGAAPGYLRLDWYDGPTEPGSSGAGAYLDATKQLVGVLCCGDSSCEDWTWDDFSAFQYIYPDIGLYLQAGSDDVFEDNDTCAAAASVAPSTYTALVLKYADGDWYRVHSSSCGPVEIRLDFTDAFGDIDMKLFDACGGNLVAASTGDGDTEVISLAPGVTADYWLRVYLAGSVRNTYNMTITAPAGGTAVYPIPAGVAIPDNYAPGVDHGFFVSDHTLMAGLKVGLKITHTWNGDLRVRLTHNGTTVTLIDRPGVPARALGFNNDGFDVILDDAAFTAIEDYDSGGPMVVGTFKPNQMLSAFNGQDAYGPWTLNVADLALYDVGTLDQWDLYVPPAEACECGGDGDFNGDGATDLADFAAFQRCFTGSDAGPLPPGCQVLNFDCDRDVDLEDFSEFIDNVTGPR